VNDRGGTKPLRVIWRARETAAALDELLAAGGVPSGIDVRLLTDLAAAELEKDWADALVDPSGRESLLDGANLRTVVVPYAGVPDRLRRAALERRHLTVRNSHYNGTMVAQHAAALLLAVANRVVYADGLLREGNWGDKGEAHNLGVNLVGKRALLLGYGTIGRALGPILRSLGLDVTAFTRSGRAPDGVTVVGPDGWRTALGTADVVVSSLPATPETIGLVGEAELAAMPRGAIVVNVGRGPVIDEGALYRALRSGHLFGAGLDVWYRYPEDRAGRAETLPASEPFHRLDSVVMSPHRADEVSGWQRHAVADVLETLQDVLRGGRRNVVDLVGGY